MNGDRLTLQKDGPTYTIASATIDVINKRTDITLKEHISKTGETGVPQMHETRERDRKASCY